MGIDTKGIMKKFNVRPVKSLGQNFLTDDSVIERIIDAADIRDTDLILEIGAGLGNMTAELASRAGHVVAVELDRRLIPVLNENLRDFKNVSILNRDVLQLDIDREVLGIPAMIESGFKPGAFKVVANLPYYITTPVIMNLLENDISAERMVFMVQSEVAERMAAKPGGKTYGALSVAVQYYSRPERIFEVPPHCFIPQPEVYSSIVRLDIFTEPPVLLKDKELFFKTVKASFGQRRKTLVNALYNSGYFNISKEEIKEILKNISVGENQRGETLSIMQFAELSNFIFSKNN